MAITRRGSDGQDGPPAVDPIADAFEVSGFPRIGMAVDDEGVDVCQLGEGISDPHVNDRVAGSEETLQRLETSGGRTGRQQQRTHVAKR
ncbi:MAG: hypothetical protein NVS3B21_01370 [Acidimicrobiales bacterium]